MAGDARHPALRRNREPGVPGSALEAAGELGPAEVEGGGAAVRAVLEVLEAVEQADQLELLLGAELLAGLDRAMAGGAVGDAVAQAGPRRRPVPRFGEGAEEGRPIDPLEACRVGAQQH